jgi:hypothetical protein
MKMEFATRPVLALALTGADARERQVFQFDGRYYEVVSSFVSISWTQERSCQHPGLTPLALTYRGTCDDPLPDEEAEIVNNMPASGSRSVWTAGTKGIAAARWGASADGTMAD